MTAPLTLWIGTRTGAFLFRTKDRKNWRIEGPHFRGAEVNHVAPDPRDPKRVYAAVNSAWFGAHIHASSDGGKTWKLLRKGLPQKNAYLTVLREAMTADALSPAGVYFGTSGGMLYGTRNAGESCTVLADSLPPVYSVTAA